MAETIPGGYYLGSDGQPHDANGKPLPKKSESAVKAEAEKATEAAATPLAPTGAPLPKAKKAAKKAKG